MIHELVVQTKIIEGDMPRRVSIAIDNGRITSIGTHRDGRVKLDMEKYLALPGGVDIHTHMREPGMTHKEDFFTGTRSAAFGGTTTILDMPNTVPGVTNAADFKEKMFAVREKANVDFGLFAELSNIDEIGKLSGLATGFKYYMSDTTGTDGVPSDSAERLLISGHLAGKVITVHAEDPSLFASDRCTDLHRHNLIRNMKAELDAVKKILDIENVGTLNLAHLTTPEAVELTRRTKTNFELTPHHLLLHDAVKIGARGKVNPPLRKRPIAERLMDYVKIGRVIIASDHAPHTLEEKSGSFGDAPSGLPGAETRLPLMMALAKNRVMSYDTVQKICCQNPADLFGMKKGRIEEGYDADFCFFDLNRIVKLSDEMMHSKCGWTPFEGFDAIFPEHVMLRGKMILEDRFFTEEKTGQYLG